MKINFIDLSRQYHSIKKEIEKAVSTTFAEASFIGGQEVEAFERAFGEYLGASFCVSCGNGTDAIEILLQAVGIGQGDEVIIPAHTWISTAGAVINAGAIPVFVDTMPLIYNIDPAGIEKAITARTKAIIAVHLYGNPAEMDPICALAKKYHLFVLEDCAQSHGATYKGKKTGILGHAAAFSFYPTKNLGAYGDGGAIITNDPDLADKIRMICNYGQKEKHHHLLHGRNSRMDTLQASVLRVKLKYLDKWNAMRLEHAHLYISLLHKLPIGLPLIPAYSKSVYHLFVIQATERDALIPYLKGKGIATAIHYPSILPEMPLFKSFHKHEYPVSQDYQAKIISLPMFPELRRDELEYTATKIAEFLSSRP